MNNGRISLDPPPRRSGRLGSTEIQRDLGRLDRRRARDPSEVVTLGSELKMAASGPAGQRIHRQRGVRGKSKSRVVTVDDQALKSQVTVKSGGLPARGGAKAEGGRGLGWGGSRCGRPR